MAGCVNTISPAVTLYSPRTSPSPTSRSSFSFSGDTIYSLYRLRHASRSPSIISPKFQIVAAEKSEPLKIMISGAPASGKVAMVELRSHTHLNSHMHHIRAIKDRSIKVVMNIDARRKPKLKFRQLVDVYNQEHIQYDDCIPRDVKDLDNVSDITQGSCLFGAEVNIETDREDFSMITLEKIRKQCKEKKRKLSLITNTVCVEEMMLDSFRDIKLVPYCSATPNFPGMLAIEDSLTIKPVEEASEDGSEEFNKQIVLYGCVSTREEMELDVPQHSEFENIGRVENLISSYTSSECEEVLKENEEWNVTGLEIVEIEAPEILAIDYYPCLPITNYCVENTEIVWETEDITMDDLPRASDILQLTNHEDDSTSSLEEDQLPEQSSSSNHEDEVGDHKLLQLCKEPDEVQQVAETDSIQPHHPPERLLSGRRKALSPTSQAKLCKAMELPGSPEKRSKKSKGKIYFSSQYSHRILKAEGLDNINRVDVIPSSKQVIRKANNNTQTQYQRSTHKFPGRDTQAAKAHLFSTGCTSIQGCSQKAIAFSQGQMRDFQYVAARLTKELKSMRQITKRCLLAESNTSNISEVTTLIRNAERTEASSKKRLSMIERDCNRFCKLMGMVRDDSPATENIVQKKKKVKFADDAGGDLCQVNVFEIHLESESSTKSVKLV